MRVDCAEAVSEEVQLVLHPDCRGVHGCWLPSGPGVAVQPGNRQPVGVLLLGAYV